MSSQIFYLLIGITCFGYILGRILDYLNLRSWSVSLPDTLKSYYDSDTYTKAQRYNLQQEKLSFITETLNFLLVMLVIISGFFGILNNWLMAYTTDPIILALAFFGVIFFVSDILNVPFAIYETFVLEAKYGFNRTTLKTFIIDKFKSYVLVIVLGGLITALLLWIIIHTAGLFWIYAFVALTAVSVVLNYFYGSVIIPLFNKLTPLENGDLRNAIEKYAGEVGFPLTNVYVIDGSKRSTKSNAFFTGFWRKKKIVLYDTLISKHSTSELLAILAHEIGHYKKKHVLMGMLVSAFELLLMFFIMSKLIFNKDLSIALGAENYALHINLIAFVILYQPISIILGLLGSHLSRKHEFQADSFAVNTTGSNILADALIRLSVDHLSNLTPHPAYVFFNYSHPPLLKRIENINKSGSVNSQNGEEKV